MKNISLLLLILCSCLLLVGCGEQKDFQTGSSNAGNTGVKNTVAEKEDNQKDDYCLRRKQNGKEIGLESLSAVLGVHPGQ